MKNNRGVEVSLPARLTEVVDEVGSGAYLKRMTDDVRAIVVDYVEGDGDRGSFIVAMVKKRFRKDVMEHLPTEPKDYVIEEITNTDEWIVLCAGNDFVLIE